ncbi:MAG: hypothetical protein KC445_00700 [Anaerolineales bacterium]|nr:hypothetical protein [Anaerolineales bacterium]
MQNGNAFRAFTDDARQFLAGLNVVTYYTESLPVDTDERFRQIIEQFLRGTAVEQVQFQQSLAAEQRSLFGIYGHRAATLAVRQNSRDSLFSGLVGAVIANYVIPPKRNVEVSLAVYHHCARKLDVSPVDLFDEAAEFAQPNLAQKMHNFGRRGDINLKHFGWQEQKTPEGVRYKFSW